MWRWVRLKRGWKACGEQSFWNIVCTINFNCVCVMKFNSKSIGNGSQKKFKTPCNVWILCTIKALLSCPTSLGKGGRVGSGGVVHFPQTCTSRQPREDHTLAVGQGLGKRLLRQPLTGVDWLWQTARHFSFPLVRDGIRGIYGRARPSFCNHPPNTNHGREYPCSSFPPINTKS